MVQESKKFAEAIAFANVKMEYLFAIFTLEVVSKQLILYQSNPLVIEIFVHFCKRE
jgi:hypothetical protein